MKFNFNVGHKFNNQTVVCARALASRAGACYSRTIDCYLYKRILYKVKENKFVNLYNYYLNTVTQKGNKTTDNNQQDLGLGLINLLYR